LAEERGIVGLRKGNYIHTLHGLTQLRKELTREMEGYKEEAARLLADIEHVEHVISILDPSADFKPLKFRRRQYRKSAPYKRGTGAIHVLDVLRRATEPMTAMQVTEAVLRRIGKADPTYDETRTAYGSVHEVLKRLDGKRVERVGEGKHSRWRLAC
jgi:hypothetical protein